MRSYWKRGLCAVLALAAVCSLWVPAEAKVVYPQDVTAEMSDAAYWAAREKDAQKVLLTQEEIAAYNRDTAGAKGTMVMDLKSAQETFDGRARNEAVQSSATSDAKYYFGWTYDNKGNKADWSYYEKMIRNCVDPRATSRMALRYGIAVKRSTLRVFPSENPILDDPADTDFDYQHLSAIRVNEPLLLYTTSADGKYYLARMESCSGWVAAEDVAVCANKQEWLSAWDLPSEKLLVVYGNKVYTDASNTSPETARRMLTMGTALELVPELEADQLVGNRSPFHNHVAYLPVRNSDGSYTKEMALIPETAKVSEGYLPLTKENIAMVALGNLGDAYGWGGMMDVEDCSGLIRSIYQCFGLSLGRNGNWQWNMNMEKLDMTNMALEEKHLVLDGLPLGAALCFNGHEMMYLGKVDGKYYVLSTVSSIMSPDTGNRLRTRDVMINTLDLKRASGQTWLAALNKAFMPCYATNIGEKGWEFPTLQWYHEGVAYCLQNKLLTPGEDGNFGISKTVTRGELAEVLWAMAGKPESGEGRAFTDVPEEHSAKAAISWAAETGVMTGYGGGTFAPQETVTRQQLVAALWRYAGKPESDASLSAFADAGKVSSYALPAVRWAYETGIVTGTGANILMPAAKATRAQLAVMVWRVSQLPGEEEAAEETQQPA